MSGIGTAIAGKLLKGGGGGGGDAYTPSAEEKELYAQQAELIEQQVAQLTKQNELLDTLWPQISDLESGKLDLQSGDLALQSIFQDIRKELAPLQGKLSEEHLQTLIGLQPELADAFSYTEGGDELQNLLRDRYKSSIEGTEDISPALDQQLADERSAMENNLSQRLGPNWAQTTPGIQAMSEMEQRHSLVREEARQGMINTAGSNYLAYTGSRQAGLLGAMGMSSSSGGGSGGGTSAGSGLMGGANASSAMQNMSNLAGQYKDIGMTNLSAKMGQQAGQSQAVMGGLLGGAQIGATVGGVPGAIIGGGIGMLSGYLLN